jgi:hypothetical protein
MFLLKYTRVYLYSFGGYINRHKVAAGMGGGRVEQNKKFCFAKKLNQKVDLLANESV